MHYSHALIRDKAASFSDPEDVGRLLRHWLMEFVDATPDSSSEITKILHPLTAADVELKDDGRIDPRVRVHVGSSRSAEPPTSLTWRRGPTVHIEYDVEMYGAEQKVRLPFIIGVVDDNLERVRALARVLRDLLALQALAMADSATILEAQNDAIDALQVCTTEARGIIAEALHHLAVMTLKAPLQTSRDPRDLVREIISRIDRTLSNQVTLVLHHPDFQQLERTWLGLFELVNSSATGERVGYRVMNISKRALLEAVRDDATSAASPRDTVFQELRGPYLQFGGYPFGCLIGDYYIDHSPDDIELLKGVGEIAAQFHCPFIVGAAPSIMEMDSWLQVVERRDVRKIFSSFEFGNWQELRDSEISRYLGVAMPRFLGAPLEHPARLHEFRFIANDDDPNAYRWLNSSYAVGTVIARAFERYQWPARIYGVETGGTLDGLDTAPGDARFPNVRFSTEVALSDSLARQLDECGLISLVSRRNTGSATFFRVSSLHRPRVYEDVLETESASLAAQLPYVLAACRFAHYLRAIYRDKIGVFNDRDALERHLNDWLVSYVDGDPPGSSEPTKSSYPLTHANVRLESAGNDALGECGGTAEISPHFQLRTLVRPLLLSLKFVGPDVREV